jgi:two-component system, NarL family, sensor histidine kinase UhpB
MAVHGKASGNGLSGSHMRIAAILRQPAVASVFTFAVALAAALGMWHFGHDAGQTVLIPSLAGALLLAGIAFLVAREHTGTPEATDQARTRSTLNEARLMGIIRSSMEAIITIDESQRIVIFNPMAEQVFGCSAMEAIGAPLSRFIPERFRAGHARHVDQFGITGVSDRQMGKQRVLFGLRANGEEFPIEASISQIHDGTGKLYTVMLRDVTARVEADNALRQSRAELRELSANLQSVREEEKTRIARELHDDLGQQLTALKMDLSSIEQLLVPHPAAGADLLDQLSGMRRLIDTTVASVRRIAADLRPVMLDDLGLIPAIDWLANDFTNRYGIKVERGFESGDTSFTRNGATTLFRIVQETLTNVARHAEATCVTLTIRVEGGYCVLHIADNGRGTAERDGRNEKSFGLLGIRERAHMLGGSVAIDTAEGEGFAITVTFPLQAVQQDEMLP